MDVTGDSLQSQKKTEIAMIGTGYQHGDGSWRLQGRIMGKTENDKWKGQYEKGTLPGREYRSRNRCLALPFGGDGDKTVNETKKLPGRYYKGHGKNRRLKDVGPMLRLRC